MKKHLFVLLLASHTYLCADYEWGSAAPISVLFNFVIAPELAYNPTDQSMAAAFGLVGPPNVPYYSFFSNGSWGPAGQIGGGGALGEFSANAVIALTYYGRDSSHVWVTAWSSSANTLQPAYSVYNGSAWTTAAQIGDNEQSAGLGISLTSYFDTVAGHQMVMAGYEQTATPGTPGIHYSLYDGLTHQFLAADTSIITNNPNGENQTVLVSTGNSVMVTYSSRVNSHPYYSIYNTHPGPGYAWTTPAPIVSSLPNDNPTPINTAYDPVNNTVIAVWNSGQTPYYSICQNPQTFTAGQWSTPAVIPLGLNGTSINPLTIAYNSDTQAFVVIGGELYGTNYYSILIGTVWSPGQIVPPIADSSLTNLTYNPSLHSMFAAWTNLNSTNPLNQPFYTTLSFVIPPSPTTAIIPPSNVIEILRQNRFLSQSQFYAQILWGATTSTSAVGYHIYKNGNLIATLPLTATSFTDPCSSCSSTYQVSAFDSSGNESILVVASSR